MLNDEVACRYWLLCPYLRFLLPSCNGIALLCNVIIFTPPPPHKPPFPQQQKKAWGKKQKCILTKVNKNDKFLHSIKKKWKGEDISHRKISEVKWNSKIETTLCMSNWGEILFVLYLFPFVKGRKDRNFLLIFIPRLLQIDWHNLDNDS